MTINYIRAVYKFIGLCKMQKCKFTYSSREGFDLYMAGNKKVCQRLLKSHEITKYIESWPEACVKYNR